MTGSRADTPAASRIHRLPQAVADAIAAGEVVERPASVVKELCENALDAGASLVEIDIEGGGTTRIRVRDDGAGIAPGDLPLAVARHATSKIRAAEDLVRVGTLGFRGEALASIAAVSDLEIVSRASGAEAAARIRVRAGDVLEHGPCAGSPGTVVEVRDLFASTPARLRFLRSARAEVAAAVRAAGDLALAHPEARVVCRGDGRVALRSPGGSAADATRAVLGAAAAAELIPVDVPGTVSVRGLVAEPRAHRAARGVVVVVNGRRVHNRSLVAAVEEAYRGLIPAGRHPFGVLTVTLDPAEVDVNVHPAKREVRFRDERAVFAAVERACWVSVRGARPYGVPSAWAPADGERALGVGDAASAGPVSGGAPSGWTSRAPAASPRLSAALWDGLLGTDPRALEIGHGGAGDGDAVPARPQEVAAGATLASLAPLRALGQAGASWLVASSPVGVVLVDPHAAHEKVLYTEMMAAWEAAGAGRGAAGRAQLLLIPAVVECDAARMARYEASAGLLRECGFALEAFGPGLVRCTEVPAGERAGADAARLVADVLDGLEGAAPDGERRHRVAALVACHSAVRFGDALAPDEQQRLLDRVVATPGGATCPHGRPALIVLDDAALRRAFRRPPV